jgi:hypothetical protein
MLLLTAVAAYEKHNLLIFLALLWLKEDLIGKIVNQSSFQ